MKVSLELEDIRNMQQTLKQAKITKMLQNVKEGIEEREITKAENKVYYQQPGYTEFPYTHGDAVQEVRKQLL